MLNYAIIAAVVCANMQSAPLKYEAWLESPGGRIRFELDLTRSENGSFQTAQVVNGEERIDVRVGNEVGGHIILTFDDYDSSIRAKVHPKTSGLRGEWSKRSADDWVRMPFAGIHPEHQKAPPALDATGFEGRWLTKFADDEQPAVGIFEAGTGALEGQLLGTFLTTTGDYRYLAGTVEKGKMRLSCFDGAHAFLFTAEVQKDGSLKGDFWSGPKYHTTWTAVRDDDAALPDPFGLTKFTGSASALDALSFPDADGKVRSLGEFAGKPRIIEIFGTWCPNCLDATRTLVDLDTKYSDNGLQVIGIAFELTGDADRDRAQVKLYTKNHNVKYPMLIAGKKDKEQSIKAFPVIDKIRAYPTFIFIDAKGEVRGVYTGFSGPATEQEHVRLTRAFKELVEGMLKDAGK